MPLRRNILFDLAAPNLAQLYQVLARAERLWARACHDRDA